jgi:tRNA 2-thiouridine synthesizing protein A
VTTVDARGLSCPLPLTMTKRRMAGLRVGEELLVMATDPEAPVDLAAWAAEEGHAYRQRERDSWTEFVLRKGGVSGAA